MPRVLILLIGILVAAPVRADDLQNPFIGYWALTLENGQAGWLEIGQADGSWTAQLKRVGQSKAITDIRPVDGKLLFTRQCKVGAPLFPGGPPTGKRVPCACVATLDGDSISIVLTAPDKTTRTHTGKRLPPLPPKPDLSKIKFGEAIELFNGTDLTGWKLTNSKQLNGWTVVDGILVNESPKKGFEPFSRYGNLRTEREFEDGVLTIEFNVPKGGNSGIYVRGAYEAQVVDRDSKMQGIQGVGAIFSRIEPTKNAGKVGGEWQSYEITIVDRHATVVLNGEKVIDNQPILGNTNGALTADITKPGALYLQGDHTAVSYRNIKFSPRIKNEGAWIQLFNGRDLQGWVPKIRGHAIGVNFRDTFRVEDGNLVVSYEDYQPEDLANMDGKPKNTFDRIGHLFTKKSFSHYLLRAEYRFVGEKLENGSKWAYRNNGLMLHCQHPATMGMDQKFPVSLEAQLLGGDGTEDRPTLNLCTPGTNVMLDGKLHEDHFVHSTGPTFHGDQWVTVEVEVRGNQSVRHFVNGKVVMEATHPQLDPRSPDAKPLMTTGTLQIKEGRIAIQAEGHSTEFRKIELLPLPIEE